jgi:hypothetical protein
MKIAYVLYPDFTALDLIGPYEVISRWPDAEVHFLARSLEPVRCDCGLTVIPTDTPATLPDPDLIVVPGSGKPVPVMSDRVLVDWLRAAAPNCKWTASVCTGAGLYAAAGLLEGEHCSSRRCECCGCQPARRSGLPRVHACLRVPAGSIAAPSRCPRLWRSRRGRRCRGQVWRPNLSGRDSPSSRRRRARPARPGNERCR